MDTCDGQKESNLQFPLLEPPHHQPVCAGTGQFHIEETPRFSTPIALPCPCSPNGNAPYTQSPRPPRQEKPPEPPPEFPDSSKNHQRSKTCAISKRHYTSHVHNMTLSGAPEAGPTADQQTFSSLTLLQAQWVQHPEPRRCN